MSLMTVVLPDNEKAIHLFYIRGANFEAKTITTGDKPIHYAASNGHWKSVYKLLLMGSDVNSQNNDGLTPLHLAVRKIESLISKVHPSYLNYKRTIEVLLQSNADRCMPDHEERTPSDLIQDEDIVELFQHTDGVARKECIRYVESIFLEKLEPRAKRNTNGVPATSAEFPWMAAVGSKNVGPEKPHFYCGGTILAEYFVMTAAHCIERDVQMVVRLGTEFIRREPTIGQDHIVEKVIRHNYSIDINERSHFRGNRNDIALLRLRTPIRYSNVVRPACLYWKRDEKSPDVQLVVAGWGITEKRNLSDVLIKTTLITMPRSECANYFTHRTVTDSQYCAYDPAYEMDPCFGDSGGPLQLFQTGSSMAMIIGIISHGIPACPSMKPDIYTKVGYYLDWIQSHVWPNETAMKYLDEDFNNFDSGVIGVAVPTRKGGNGVRAFVERTIDRGI